jgi:hypothetical protein
MTATTGAIPGPHVVFEPGIHPLGSGWDNKMFSVEDGNLRPHVWNEAVRSRMRRYRPGLVAIDSLLPMEVDADGSISYDTEANIWVDLPGTPRQLNGTDEILVLAGDNTYGSSDPNTGEDLAIRSANICLDFGIAQLGAATLAATAHEAEVRTSKELWPNLLLEQRISRRELFGLAAAAALIFCVASPTISAESSRHTPEHLLNEVDDVYTHSSIERLIDHDHLFDYVLGRTALLIAKVNDAAANTNLTVPQPLTASVVMGSAHEYESARLIADPKYRAACIATHTRLMAEVVKAEPSDSILDYYPGGRMAWLSDQQTTYQIFRVRQPDMAQLSPNPRDVLDPYVSFVTQANAPSVEQAIAGIL